ncbi:hypothetical protein ACFQ78_37575 [Streptomyces sp. NPDC056519]|uniref:hypothetical protein n=1 Tax=Streptomyces sp. NPDC056519 TaxID=3345849 RepID=UPI0036819864
MSDTGTAGYGHRGVRDNLPVLPCMDCMGPDISINPPEIGAHVPGSPGKRNVSEGEGSIMRLRKTVSVVLASFFAVGVVGSSAAVANAAGPVASQSVESSATRGFFVRSYAPDVRVVSVSNPELFEAGMGPEVGERISDAGTVWEVKLAICCEIATVAVSDGRGVVTFQLAASLDGSTPRCVTATGGLKCEYASAGVGYKGVVQISRQ